MLVLIILPSFANYWAVQLHGDASQAVILGTPLWPFIGLVFVPVFQELLLYLAQKGLSRSWILCLNCGIQCLSPHSTEVRSPQGSLLNAWSKIACLVALDLMEFWWPVFRWRHLYLRALSAHGYPTNMQVKSQLSGLFIFLRGQNWSTCCSLYFKRFIFIEELLWNLQIFSGIIREAWQASFASPLCFTVTRGN